MDRCIALLEQLKAFTEEMDVDYYIPENITESDQSLIENFVEKGNEGAPMDFLRYLNLLKDLESAAKSSKRIRQFYQRGNLNASQKIIDEDDTTESFQRPLDWPKELNESTDMDKTAESIEQTLSSSEYSKELNESTDEDKIAESFQNNLQYSESSVKASEERKTFRVLLDVSHFLRKEVSVKVIGKHLVVHGEHEALFDEHGKVSRKFTRKFDIPEDVDSETFRAFLDCYRVLTIEASFKPMYEKGGDFEVPIYDEIDSQHLLSPFQNLEDNFEELVKRHLNDGKFMRDFVRKLSKQRPSDYIPMEEVL